MGEDLDGEEGGDWSGFGVGISADGTRVIMRARSNDGNGTDSGHAHINQDMMVLGCRWEKTWMEKRQGVFK